MKTAFLLTILTFASAQANAATTCTGVLPNDAVVSITVSHDAHGAAAGQLTLPGTTVVEEISLVGKQSYEAGAEVYALNDPQGSFADLTLKEIHSPANPKKHCGRGSCDFWDTYHTVGELTYKSHTYALPSCYEVQDTTP